MKKTFKRDNSKKKDSTTDTGTVKNKAANK